MALDIYGSDEAPTMKGEKNEVKLWHERIGLAKKAQEQWAQDSGAKRFIQEYKGNYDLIFYQRNGKKVPIPPINDVFSYVQADIATTYNRDPYITVNAEAGSPQGAALWEVIINYYWRHLKTKEELEYEIIDKDLVGFSWHKVGLAVQSSGSGDQLKLDSENLYSKYLSWKDVLWNIGSKRPPVDSLWMAQRIVRPLSEVKRKYPAAKGLEGSPDPGIDPDDYKKSAYKDDIKVAVLWEVWDAEKRQIRLLAEGLEEKYLDKPKPWPEYLTEFPFLMYWDFAVPGCPQPMSAIAPWESQIKEKMVLMASGVNHAKRWNRQAFVKNGTIDENSLDKYERGDDGAIIVYNGDTADIKFADFGQLPTDFYLLMDRLDAIARSTNGQPEFVKGGVTKTGTRTIGELNLIQQGNKDRQGRKIDRLETHCENIARHMMAHLKANFDMPQVIKITGDVPEKIIDALGDAYNPTTGEVTFTPADIIGEYDADVKAGSTLPLDKQTRIQVLELIMQTVAAAVGQGPISPFLNVLIQELLKDYDIKGLQEAYEQEVAMAQQAQAEQEGQQSIEDQKTTAEAQKRMSQAQQIDIESEILAQDAQIGPIGRAAVKQLEKPEQKPATNGTRK